MAEPNPSTTEDAEVPDVAEDKPEGRSVNKRQKVNMQNQDNGLYINRILSEFFEFSEGHTPWGIEVAMVHDELSIWSVKILGPIGSPFEGGIFKGILLFNDLYPFSPPTFKFLSRMFHPNISEDGEPCLDRLYHEWSPCYKVWALLGSIQFLLNNPCAETPTNLNAATFYNISKRKYKKMVQGCVLKSIQDHERDLSETGEKSGSGPDGDQNNQNAGSSSGECGKGGIDVNKVDKDKCEGN